MKKEHSLSHRIYVLKADLVSIPVELVDLWAVGNFFEDSLTKQVVDRSLPMVFFFNVIFSFCFFGIMLLYHWDQIIWLEVCLLSCNSSCSIKYADKRNALGQRWCLSVMVDRINKC